MRNLIICETCQIPYKPSNISYDPTTGNAIGIFSCSKCGHQIACR